jgi:TonB family protein
MNRTWTAALFIASLTISSFSSAQDAASLQKLLETKLKGTVLSLRTPAPNPSLTFDSNGLPTHKLGHGLASADRDLLIKEVHVTDKSLQLKGERVYYVWDSKNKHLQGMTQQNTVLILLKLSKPNLTEADIAPALNEIFLTGKERDEGVCRPEENAAFNEIYSNGKVRTLSEQEQIDARNAPPVQSKSELQTICLQKGQRGYRTVNGINPAKALVASDPSYTQTARQQNVQGTVIYAVRIDQQGLPTDALLVQPLEPTLNMAGIEALRSWKFQPATFQAEPVAVVVMVEINFRLH